MKKLFVILFFLLIAGNAPVYAADPIIKLYGISDYAVTGSAYDPDCPSNPIDVHVYSTPNEGGVVCRAAYLCPWSGVCDKANTGFWCLLRHPVNSSSVPSAINVAAINQCGSGANVWADKSSAVANVFHAREQNTIFIDKPTYKVGISKKFGAAIVEYYNKRVDSTLNLVQPDPGSAFQSAIFGANNVGSSPNCFGANDVRYNPTQAGSHCGHPNGSDIISTDFSGNQLKFLVHFKNFYYPKNAQHSYPYQGYDDVYGYITYVFEDNYMKVNYQLWKTEDAIYGVNFQQLPISFLTQLTKFTYKNNGSIITDDALYNSSRGYTIDNPSDGRWVTAKGSATGASPNNFVTLAFYSKPYKGVCQPRLFQMDYLPNDGGVQYAAAIQNNVTFQAEKNQYIEFQTYVFPYKYDENLPNTAKTIGTMSDSYAALGGFMPDWECNMPSPTPTPTPTPIPTATSSLTPTPTTPLPGDLNGDNHVNIYDYNLLIAKFDNPYTIFDYNILVGNFGK